MNSFIWYQSANLDKSDIVTHNGVILTEGADRDSALKELKKTADKVIGKNIPWCGSVGKYFFFKGDLDGKDEKGRILNFLFACEGNDYQSALEKELKAIGYKLSSESEKCLLSKKKDFGIKYALMVIAILVILIIIFNIYLPN